MNLRAVTLAAFALALLPVVSAQDTAPVAPPTQIKHLEVNVRAEGRMGVDPIKGVPFCATVTSDHTQVFADGNRIHTSDSSLVCRDSQGRIRREAQLNLLGAVPQGTTPKMITIDDPVAGVRYVMDTFAKVAQKMPLMPHGPGAPGAKAGGDVVFFSKSASFDGPAGPPPPPPNGAPVFISERVLMKGVQIAEDNPPATENLGDQSINGINAAGTRLTTTIPAGKMGNEEPIKVVSENWYSPELKATVMTKHSDPWSGQLTTQFTNVNTSEPDPLLFTVPSDYKIVDEKSGPVMIHLQAPPPQQ